MKILEVDTRGIPDIQFTSLSYIDTEDVVLHGTFTFTNVKIIEIILRGMDKTTLDKLKQLTDTTKGINKLSKEAFLEKKMQFQKETETLFKKLGVLTYERNKDYDYTHKGLDQLTDDLSIFMENLFLEIDKSIATAMVYRRDKKEVGNGAYIIKNNMDIGFLPIKIMIPLTEDGVMRFALRTRVTVRLRYRSRTCIENCGLYLIQAIKTFFKIINIENNPQKSIKVFLRVIFEEENNDYYLSKEENRLSELMKNGRITGFIRQLLERTNKNITQPKQHLKIQPDKQVLFIYKKMVLLHNPLFFGIHYKTGKEFLNNYYAHNSSF